MAYYLPKVILHAIIVTIVSTPPKRVFTRKVVDIIDTPSLSIDHDTIIEPSTFLQISDSPKFTGV
jgi:hypothetical protein